MLVNLTVLRWIGIYQEMMPEAQSVKAFLAWRDACVDLPAVELPRCWHPPAVRLGILGGTSIGLNVSRGEGTAEFAG